MLPQADVSGSVRTGAPAAVIRRRAADRGAALHEPGPGLVGDDRSKHGRRAVCHAEAPAARLERGLLPLHGGSSAPDNTGCRPTEPPG